MTEEEAIKALEVLKNLEEAYRNADSDSIFSVTLKPYVTLEDLCNAISAIEKQIAKKPRFEDLGYDLHHNVNVYGILCPECGGLIIKCNDDDFGGEFPGAIWEEWDMEVVEINNGYCGHCGQHIDWEEGGENG